MIITEQCYASMVYAAIVCLLITFGMQHNMVDTWFPQQAYKPRD